RSFLNALAVFQGGWTLEAAQAVSPDTDAVEMLTLLRDASLINATEEDRHERYTMLENVRQFAAEILEEWGRGAEVRQRHAGYLFEWTGNQYTNLLQQRDNDSPPYYAQFEREYSNLRAALTWTLDTGDDRLIHFCHSLSPFWNITGRIGDA